MWNEAEAVKFFQHYLSSIQGPFFFLHVSLLYQLLLHLCENIWEFWDFPQKCNREFHSPLMWCCIAGRLVLTRCSRLTMFKVREDCRWTLLGILQESWTLKDSEDESEIFLQNGENHLLCSTVSHFRRTESFWAFCIRGLTLSYYFLQTVSVLGFHRLYHFMMAPEVKGWQYSVVSLFISWMSEYPTWCGGPLYFPPCMYGLHSSRLVAIPTAAPSPV